MKVRVQVMIEQSVFDQLKIEADERQVSVSAIARQKITSMTNFSIEAEKMFLDGYGKPQTIKGIDVNGMSILDLLKSNDDEKGKLQ